MGTKGVIYQRKGQGYSPLYGSNLLLSGIITIPGFLVAKYTKPTPKMKPRGTIYRRGLSKNHGEFVLKVSAVTKIAYNFIRGFGLGSLFFALFILYSYFSPLLVQNFKYYLNSGNAEAEVKAEEIAKNQTAVQSVVDIQKEAGSYQVNSHFSVVIPKISANSNVIANVDVSNKKEYMTALKAGVAHARGTNFPGQPGRIFLFSHSTDSPLNYAKYNAVFYLLRKLTYGDKIIVYFSDRKYIYEVKDIKIVEVKDTSWLGPKPGEEELVLMTCDPPGTTKHRLLVIAKPVSNI